MVDGVDWCDGMLKGKLPITSYAYLGGADLIL